MDQKDYASKTSDDVAYQFKPYVILDNLMGEKSAERARLKSLGFEVIDINEKDEKNYSTGERVEAKRGGASTDSWVQGVIEQVQFIENSVIRTGKYDIKFYDGSSESSVDWSNIRKIELSAKSKPIPKEVSTYKANDNVQIWSNTTGPWKEAIIIAQMIDTQSVDVQCVDGSFESSIPLSMVRPFKPPPAFFSENESVYFKLPGTGWKDGIIMKSLKNSEYTIGTLSAVIYGSWDKNELNVISLEFGEVKPGMFLSAAGIAPDTQIKSLKSIMTTTTTTTTTTTASSTKSQDNAPSGNTFLLDMSQEESGTGKITLYTYHSKIQVSNIRPAENAVCSKITAKELTAIISPNQYLIAKVVLADEICTPVENQLNYSPHNKVRIVLAALNRLESCGYPKSNMWLQHEPEFKPQISDIYFKENNWRLDKRSKDEKNETSNKINDYYGSKIALYFGWCSFYTNWLLVPSFLGVYHYIETLFTGKVSHFGTFFSIFLSLWSTVFIEYWKRRNSEFAFNWGVFGYDELEFKRSIAKRVGSSDPNKFLRFALTVPAVLCILIGLSWVMLYFIHLQDNADVIYGATNPLKYYPMIVYSIIPSITSKVLRPIVDILTDFEEHSSKIDLENHRIYKHFALQFVNSYCMLFYIAFWLKDFERLKKTLFSMLVISQITGDIFELLPWIQSNLFSIGVKKDKPEAKQRRRSQVLTSVQEQFKDDNSKETYDVGSDYMELLIQFGYVAMFSSILPWIPFAAFVNNYYEGRVDFIKLSNCKRPLPEERSGMGAWLVCLEIVSFFGVITNCYLLGEVLHDIPSLFPSQHSEFLSSSFGKFFVVVALEHILLILKFFMKSGIDDLPRHIQEAACCKLVNEEKFKAEERLRILFENLSRGEEGIDIMKQSRRQREIDKLIADAKVQKKYPQMFAVNPISFSIVLVFPFVMSYFSISMWVYVPAVLLFLTYMQVEKNRRDHTAAMGIVTDPEIVKYILKEMPSWTEESEAQRAEWFNIILTKLWPHISEATDQRMKSILQPKFSKIIETKGLDSIASLKLDRFSLGEICPKIKSIRVHSNHESVIRIDCDWVWSGNPEIVILLGLGDKIGIPELPIEVCDFRMSMNMRIELHDLYNTFPCFRFVSVTCMKQPFVDLSCKLGIVNLTNIGLGSLNIRELILTVVSSSLNSTLLFPNKLDVQMSNQKIPERSLVPEGLLQLTIVQAKHLMVADLFTSDPYVVVSWGDKELGRTEIKYENLNPVWNESFDVLVYDKSTQEIKLNIFDYDFMKLHDNMGYCVIQTDSIPIDKITTLELKLNGENARGTITVKCNYLPLVYSNDVHRDGEDVGEDEAFLLDLPVDLGTTMENLYQDIVRDIQEMNKIGSDHISFEETWKMSNAINNNSNHHKNKIGVLTISSIRCRNLRALPSMVEFLVPTALKCCVTFRVKGESKSTKVICNRHDPNFTESFSFVIDDPTFEMLYIDVVDKADIFADRVIGSTQHHVKDFLGAAVEKEYLLEGRNEECYVEFKTTWYIVNTDVTKRSRR